MIQLFITNDMKISTASFFTALAILFGLSTVSSCSHTERFAGAWQGNPERLEVQGAADATSTVTIDFAPTEGRRGTGTVNLSAVIEVEQAVSSFSGFDEGYETSVAATASIIGRYVCEENDDDDILVTFDPASLKVNVDPAGVTFSQNLLSGTQQPVLDSLTAVCADRWRVALAPVIRDAFGKYTRIDDIKIHHSDIMSCEIGDRDYTFRRTGTIN